jgi:hypothetical protein
MALTLSLSKTVASDGGEGSITTLTDVSNYGSPEVERNTLAVYLAPFKVDKDLKEVPLAINTYNPTTATEFTITNTVDGHQKFYFIVVPIYNSGATYLLHDVVYYPTTSKWYKAIMNNFSNIDPSNTANWEEVPKPEALLDNIGTGLESNNIFYLVYQTILDFNTRKCLMEKAIKQAKDNCGECTNKDLAKEVEDLRSIAYSLVVADSAQLYTLGEKSARLTEQYCNCTC